MTDHIVIPAGGHMSGRVLVVVDMQKFFFEENTDVDLQALTAGCGDAIKHSRDAGIPIIHVVTRYRKDRTDWPAAWRFQNPSWCDNLVDGNPLADMVDGIVPHPHDSIVVKKRFSAFYNTNLDDLLRQYGCKEICLIGYSADVCIRFTTLDAYNRGYQITLISNGIESFKESKPHALDYLTWLTNAQQNTTMRKSAE